MRKITEESVEAFFNSEPFNKGNMQVVNESSGAVLKLHGNTIAKITTDGVFITNAGWMTKTTKDRLNGVCDHIGHARIYQEAGEWFFTNGEIFPNDQWVKIVIIHPFVCELI